MQFFNDLKNIGYKDKHIDTKAVISTCLKCDGEMLWWEGSIVSPRVTTAPSPHDDMPVGVKKTFEEAREIFEISARASAALLRLALEELTVELGYANGSLDSRIGKMVKSGLSELVGQALDVVRVVGNNSVHPGQIDVNDDRDTATALFELLNYVVERLITEPAKIGKLFHSLPEGAKQAIARRNEMIKLTAPEKEDSSPQ